MVGVGEERPYTVDEEVPCVGDVFAERRRQACGIGKAGRHAAYALVGMLCRTERLDERAECAELASVDPPSARVDVRIDVRVRFEPVGAVDEPHAAARAAENDVVRILLGGVFVDVLEVNGRDVAAFGFVRDVVVRAVRRIDALGENLVQLREVLGARFHVPRRLLALESFDEAVRLDRGDALDLQRLVQVIGVVAALERLSAAVVFGVHVAAEDGFPVEDEIAVLDPRHVAGRTRLKAAHLARQRFAAGRDRKRRLPVRETLRVERELSAAGRERLLAAGKARPLKNEGYTARNDGLDRAGDAVRVLPRIEIRPVRRGRKTDCNRRVVDCHRVRALHGRATCLARQAYVTRDASVFRETRRHNDRRIPSRKARLVH